jgi:Zn-dependent protease
VSVGIAEAAGTDSDVLDGDALYATASARFAEDPRTAPGSATWFLLSALLFALFALGSFDVTSIAVLMGVIVFHELGHFAAMRLLGYEDVKIYFVPLMGALTAGRQYAVAHWKRAVVLLLGPLPGLLAALVLAIAAPERLATSEWFKKLLEMLLIINALNLLPIVPLDGGRLLSVLVFSRMALLELVFSAGTALLLVALCVLSGEWVLAAFAFLVVPGAIRQHRTARAAEIFAPRFPELTADPQKLLENELRALFLGARAVCSAAFRRFAEFRVEQQAVLVASYMRGIHERSITRPPGWPATLLLLGVYGVSLLVIAPVTLMIIAAAIHSGP